MKEKQGRKTQIRTKYGSATMCYGKDIKVCPVNYTRRDILTFVFIDCKLQ